MISLSFVAATVCCSLIALVPIARSYTGASRHSSGSSRCRRARLSLARSRQRQSLEFVQLTLGLVTLAPQMRGPLAQVSAIEFRRRERRLSRVSSIAGWLNSRSRAAARGSANQKSATIGASATSCLSLGWSRTEIAAGLAPTELLRARP